MGERWSSRLCGHRHHAGDVRLAVSVAERGDEHGDLGEQEFVALCLGLAFVEGCLVRPFPADRICLSLGEDSFEGLHGALPVGQFAAKQLEIGEDCESVVAGEARARGARPELGEVAGVEAVHAGDRTHEV
jgi:hypothetical protein